MIMERLVTMPVGVVVERRATGNMWQEWSWSAAAVIPHAGGNDRWRVLREGGGRTVYHAGHQTLELHFRETEAYLQNLDRENPAVYVVLRPADGAPPDRAVEPFLVTVSPDEAQAYVEGDCILSPVPMPGFVVDWVARFVATHHQAVPFERRPRKASGSGAHEAGPSPGVRPLAGAAWRIPGRNHG